MSVFDTEVTAEQAEASTKNYSPSVQETTEEIPEQIDRTPISAEESKALDAAQQDTFQSPFGEEGNQHQPVGGQVTTFIPPGEYVSPVQRHRQRQAMLLPPFASINDLDARISAVMRFGGAPKSVAELARQARLAVGAAREARNAASHPDNPKYTRSVEAKDETVKAIAQATTVVGALERAAEESKDEWFASLIGDLDKQRADALKAVKAAEKAYAGLRGSVNAAQALALESGMWDKSWHESVTRESDLNAPIAAMRDAVRFLESEDDFESGRFLTEDYGDAIPPHTMRRLARSAEISQSGSFAHQIHARAKAPMANDRDLHDAVRTKHLILFLNSNPLSTELMGRVEDEED